MVHQLLLGRDALALHELFNGGFLLGDTVVAISWLLTFMLILEWERKCDSIPSLLVFLHGESM